MREDKQDGRFKYLPFSCKFFGCTPIDVDRNGSWCGRTKGCHRPISRGCWLGRLLVHFHFV